MLMKVMGQWINPEAVTALFPEEGTEGKLAGARAIVGSASVVYPAVDCRIVAEAVNEACRMLEVRRASPDFGPDVG